MEFAHIILRFEENEKQGTGILYVSGNTKGIGITTEQWRDLKNDINNVWAKVDSYIEEANEQS